MATWSILLSELSVNLLKNPVFGNGTTNWANTNGTLTTNTTATNLLYGTTAGAYSGTTLAANSGIYGDLDTTATAVAGQVEFWVKGSAPEKLGVYDGVWVYSGTPTQLETGPNSYTRYVASFSAADMSGVTKAGAFWSGTITAYIGGAQCEQSSTYTTQIAGDMGPGYVWNGTEHASASTRYILDENGRTVWGGSITTLDDGASVICTGMVGAGLLPLEIEKLAVAGEVQNLFIGQSLGPRDIQLALVINGTSLANTHSQRATLLAKLPYGREVWLRYNAANSTLQIKAAVAGSFDLELDDLPFGQKTMLQFTALDPRFSLIGPERTSLTLSASPSSSYVQRRTDKDGWGAMDSGLFYVPQCFLRGPDGTIYAGTWGTGGTAKIQKWTGSAWTDMASVTGSITGGPIIYAMTIINATGTVNQLAVGGDFTTVNGNSSTGFFTIDLSTGTVTTYGTMAAGGIVRSCLYEPVRQRLYVAGDFTSFVSDSNLSYICFYGYAESGWTGLGSKRPTAAIHCMTTDGTGNIIMGGDFTNTFSLASLSGLTATAATGGRLGENTRYYVFVAAGDGTNFDFSAAASNATFDGATTLGLGGARQTFLTTTTAKQATISWTAVPGAQYYIVKLTTIGDGDLTNILSTDYFSSDTSASYTVINGTKSYDTTFAQARYSHATLKYTGTGLAANSGVYKTVSLSPSSGYITLIAWVSGTAPDKLIYKVNSGARTFATPTTGTTDGIWTQYYVSVVASSVQEVGVGFSGTVTSYISAIQVNDGASLISVGIGAFYANIKCALVPKSVTSLTTETLLSYTTPDAPSAHLYGRFGDNVYVGSTGDYGARIVKYLSASGGWERMALAGGGFGGSVMTLAWVGGSLVAGGQFTTADNQTANRVAYTRGKAWLPLGISGMSSGTVNKLAYQRGTLWAGGSFASADNSTNAAYLARLDGFPTGSWTHADVTLTNPTSIYTLLADDYSLCIADAGAYTSAAGGTSIIYSGTGNLYPKIVVTGPGVFRGVENGLTKARITMNYTLYAGERMTIDCDAATVTSTVYGDITGQLHPSSNLDGFYLAANSTQTVWCYMTGTTGASSVVIVGNRQLTTGDA
jgi:hypothetical protein